MGARLLDLLFLGLGTLVLYYAIPYPITVSNASYRAAVAYAAKAEEDHNLNLP